MNHDLKQRTLKLFITNDTDNDTNDNNHAYVPVKMSDKGFTVLYTASVVLISYSIFN